MSSSPFAAVPEDEWIADNRSGFAIWDAYPVSPGHALVVPHRRIATWWEAGGDERRDLLALIDDVRAEIQDRHAPDGYNVGFNAGTAAGQTVDHLHLHVIPRYAGDVADPRGGIRHVIPELGNYLSPAGNTAGPTGASAQFLDACHEDRYLRLELIRCLRADAYDRIDLVVSFIMASGLDLVLPRLSDAVERGPGPGF